MSEKPRWLQNLAEFLIDNFTILLTIGFAGYIIYRQEIAAIALATNELLTGILAVLGLLATSEIIERYRRLDSIQKSNRRILSFLEGRFTERPSALAFFNKLPNLDSYVMSANQIDLCGVSLTSTINKQFSNLRERLKEGANINVLVIDPDSLALQMTAERGGSLDDVEYFGKRLETTFNDLAYLSKNWLEYQNLNSASKKGSLSVRLMSSSPSYGIISFDTNRSNGILFVELYPHYSYGTQPTFELTPHRDGEWYKHFVEQFEQMWNHAKPWTPRTFDTANPGYTSKGKDEG
jgi:hypothetical protein